MKTKWASGATTSLVVALLAFLHSPPCAAATTPAPPMPEPVGALDIRLRLLDVVQDVHNPDSAVARIEVTLESFVSASDLKLGVGQTSPSSATKPKELSPGSVRWERGRPIEPQEAASGSVSLRRGEAARTVVEVPLTGLAVHEIIVSGSARGPQGLLTTEGMIRVPFGVRLPLPEDDGVVSQFRAVPAQEVRP